MIGRVMCRFHASLLVLGLGAIVALAPGCVSYRAGCRVETDPPATDIPGSNRLAFIKIDCETRGYVENAFRDNVAAAQAFRSVAARVLDEGGVFSAYTFSSSRGTDADVKVVLTLKHSQSGSPVGLVLSAATLGLVPFTGADSYRLTTRVLDKNGTDLWTGVVEDSMRTWIQLFLLPLGSWKSETKVRNQLLEDLLRTTLSRMTDEARLNVAQ